LQKALKNDLEIRITRHICADKIYATNKNRTYSCSKHRQTDFVPKGKKPKNYKEKQQLIAIISKERATRLERAFGKDNRVL